MRSSYRIVRANDVVILSQDCPTLPARRLVTSKTKKSSTRSIAKCGSFDRAARGGKFARSRASNRCLFRKIRCGRIVAISAAIFVAAHLALMIGLTTPDKINFDEVHYVPAAKQLLEPGVPNPLLNPMHPPLAKEFMALSIRAFGDNSLGWRYPSVVFGALAIVAMYLCGLALFAAQGPALATAAADVPQPDGVRAVADRDAGHLHAGVRSVRHRGVHLRLQETETGDLRSRWPASLSVWRRPANGAGCFRSASASRSLP